MRNSQTEIERILTNLGSIKIRAIDDTEPHPDWGGWAGFLSQECELRDEWLGVFHFGAANCNYIVFPGGELVQNYGYHGRALMTIVRQDGAGEALRLVLDARAALWGDATESPSPILGPSNG